MTLPPKVQTAIDVLGQYEISAKVVAPFWYRQYLRFRPETPPPLWGADEGYWVFRTLKLSMSLGIFMTLAGLAIASHIASPAEKLLALALPAQFAIWTIAGIAGWLCIKALADWNQQERVRIGLPEWQVFDAHWRPAIDIIRNRADLNRYWLRGIRDARMFQLGGFAGSALFLLFALVMPQKATQLGMTVAMAYAVICIIALQRSNRLRVMSPRPVVWQFSNGLWLGIVFAAVCFSTGYARWAGYPADDAILVFFVSIIFLHLLDARAYDTQRNLATRIEHTEQKRQLAEAQLQTLKAQIEPHFIFNTLAHLKSMIATDPVSAEKMADELSDFLRASLKSLRADRTTVGEDFELARAYLALAKLRMGGRLSTDIQIAGGAANVKILPLLLQTLLENAIQHGLEPKVGAGSIHVRAEIIDTSGPPKLHVWVIDDGVGFGVANSGGTGVGLANIRERLLSAYGGDAQFLLTANTPSGVIAELILPVA